MLLWHSSWQYCADEGKTMTLNMRKGVTRMPTRAGTIAALNQVNQGDTMSTPSSEASFMHSRFCAAAVRKRAEECTEVCIWECTRKEPRRSCEGSSAGYCQYSQHVTTLRKCVPQTGGVLRSSAQRGGNARAEQE